MMEEGDDRTDRSQRVAPSQAVVEAVADAEGVPPEKLCPPEYESLHHVIDPQALDALFEPKPDGTPRSPGRVSFPFCGYDVAVESDGSVTLE